MTTSELNAAINSAFFNLAHSNAMVFDYWLSELYDLNENVMIEGNWNEQTLYEMEKDVMINAQ
jgi:hypothetical protein